MASVGLAPVRAMGVENVGDLKMRPRHCGARQAGGERPTRCASRLSSGLVTSRIVLTATRV